MGSCLHMFKGYRVPPETVQAVRQSTLIAHRFCGSSVPPSAFGMRWSTSVAGSTRPVRWHSSHRHR